MKNTSVISSLLLLLLLSLGTASHADDNRGRITYLRGAVTAIDDTGVPRILRADSRIRLGEIVETGPNSVVQIVFPDRSMMHLKPNTRLTVEAFNFTKSKPDDDGVVVNIVKGSMRSLTGLVGKRNPGKVKYKTPVATIGIRGTVIEIDQVKGGPTKAIFDLGQGYITTKSQADIPLQAGEAGQVGKQGQKPQKSDYQRPANDPASLAIKLAAATNAQITTETTIICADLDSADALLMVAIEQKVPAVKTDNIKSTVQGLSTCLPVDISSTMLLMSTYLDPDIAAELLDAAVNGGVNVAIALESVLRGMEHAPTESIQGVVNTAIDMGLSKNDAKNILNNLTEDGMCY
ncbi:MAG: FecR family protein [Pseudomonadota bacterium]